MEQQPHLWAAVLAARRGAEALSTKPTNIVERCHTDSTAADPVLIAEEAILTELQRHFPEHNVISEERSPEFATKPRWIVDPLDGTINYLNGVPHYSISIAFEGASTRDVSVVYHVSSETMFAAVEGEGSFANGERISVSETDCVEDALVVTGFDPTTMRAEDFERFRSFIERTQGVRRFGSAAAELAMVAAGQFDVFFERMLSVWDTAAGTHIVEEAGGEVTRIERLNGSNSEMVLASNEQIHRDLVALISST